MKKYIYVSLFALFLTLLGALNFAYADNSANGVCWPGDKFNSQTGEPCPPSSNTSGSSANSTGASNAPGTLTVTYTDSLGNSTSYNFGNVTLRNGSRGEAVKELQRFLNARLKLGLALDGKLGPKTIAVIKEWQKERGLTPDGLIGPKTKEMMHKEAQENGEEGDDQGEDNDHGGMMGHDMNNMMPKPCRTEDGQNNTDKPCPKPCPMTTNTGSLGANANGSGSMMRPPCGGMWGDEGSKPQIPVGTLSIDPAKVEMGVGGVKNLKSIISCPSGAQCGGGSRLVPAAWVSSDPTIVAIQNKPCPVGVTASAVLVMELACGSSGPVAVAKGLAEGTATITATFKGPEGKNLTATATVTVKGTTDSGNTTSARPTISSLDPTTGPIGTQVTITGTGFTDDNTISLADFAISNHIAATNNGTTLTFAVPKELYSSTFHCSDSSTPCPVATPPAPKPLLPGTYGLHVSNANGKSNSRIFTVTAATQ